VKWKARVEEVDGQINPNADLGASGTFVSSDRRS
jgi:hypothetical protein